MMYSNQVLIELNNIPVDSSVNWVVSDKVKSFFNKLFEICGETSIYNLLRWSECKNKAYKKIFYCYILWFCAFSIPWTGAAISKLWFVSAEKIVDTKHRI